MAKSRTISSFRAPEPYPTEDRFWRLVDRSGECWLWQGSLKHNGYARSSEKGSGTFAIHRRAYERLVGPVPEGLEIDHLCRVRHCCNPAHMEPVTHKENTLRGNTAGALNKRKTHCPQGHEYTPENTYQGPNRARACRLCRAASGRRRNEAKHKRRIHFLTTDEVAFIKANYVRGTGWANRGNSRELAAKFGVAYCTIMHAIRG